MENLKRLDEIRARNKELAKASHQIEPDDDEDLGYEPGEHFNNMLERLRGSSTGVPTGRPYKPAPKPPRRIVPSAPHLAEAKAKAKAKAEEKAAPETKVKAKARARKQAAATLGTTKIRPPRKPGPNEVPEMRPLAYEVLLVLSQAHLGFADNLDLASQVFGVSPDKMRREVRIDTGEGRDGSVRAIRNIARQLIRWELVVRVPARITGTKEHIPAGLRITGKGRKVIGRYIAAQKSKNT